MRFITDMKYKIIGFTCCFAVILIAVFAPLLYQDYQKTERIHQHEQEIPQEPCTDPADGGLCTYLPIVKIDTDGVEIPGSPLRMMETTAFIHVLLMGKLQLLLRWI